MGDYSSSKNKQPVPGSEIVESAWESGNAKIKRGETGERKARTHIFRVHFTYASLIPDYLRTCDSHSCTIDISLPDISKLKSCNFGQR